MPFFQPKQAMNKYHHISLNTQFIADLDVDLICFSVCFYSNLILVLKMHFWVFSFISKKVQGFSFGRKILMLFLSRLFHLQNCLSFF